MYFQSDKFVAPIQIIHQGLQRIQTEGNSGNLDADTDDSSSDEDANPEVHKLVRQGIYGGVNFFDCVSGHVCLYVGTMLEWHVQCKSTASL